MMSKVLVETGKESVHGVASSHITVAIDGAICDD